jgi:glycosyltransferase involved in cell wall biosynthesis
MSQRLNILYDGWSLAYQVTSWEAIHLLSLLANLPAGVRAQVALPAPPFDPLPAGIEAVLQPVENNRWGRLLWEQLTLPGLARRHQTDILHLIGIQAALFGSHPQAISPAGYDSLADHKSAGFNSGHRETARPNSLATRLRVALGQGGFTRAAGIFWPSDLPVPDYNLRVFQLPPLIHSHFTNPIQNFQQPDLPETYIIYHGPQTDAALHRLVEAWSWATGSIGEYYPLLVLGIDQRSSVKLNALLQQTSLAKTVSLLPPLHLESMIYIYQNCTAVFHPADIPPWGGPLRTALFYGKPVIALETPFIDALVGPAGYLVNPKKTDLSRALGAALITVIVEESVATGLAQAARRQAAGWESGNFASALEDAYRSLLAAE